jgi:hypothetical protein
MFWRNKNIVTKSLKFYDYLVNDINCTYAWRCHKSNIFENYKNNIKTNHLEIGPGTGYFLKNNYNINKLYLMDINEDTLNFSKNNLSLNYQVETINHNIFEDKLEIKDLDSVGLNYVLHCVPGKLEDNINNLINNLESNNKINFFGATVVSDKDLQNRLSSIELFFLNKYNIFNNEMDYSKNLIDYLKFNKISFSKKIVGNVVLFSFEI